MEEITWSQLKINIEVDICVRKTRNQTKSLVTKQENDIFSWLKQHRVAGNWKECWHGWYSLFTNLKWSPWKINQWKLFCNTKSWDFIRSSTWNCKHSHASSFWERVCGFKIKWSASDIYQLDPFINCYGLLKVGRRLKRFSRQVHINYPLLVRKWT